MKELIAKEWLYINRKRCRLQKRIEKDKAKIAEVEKRINELKPLFEDRNDFINSGVVKGDEIIINQENAEEFRGILGNAVTDLIKG